MMNRSEMDAHMLQKLTPYPKDKTSPVRWVFWVALAAGSMLLLTSDGWLFGVACMLVAVGALLYLEHFHQAVMDTLSQREAELLQEIYFLHTQSDGMRQLRVRLDDEDRRQINLAARRSREAGRPT